MTDMWTYQDSNWTADGDLSGYDVQATDGSIGEIGESQTDAGSARVIVETGFWIFGKKRMIPAGAITSVDHDAREVHVNMTKDQIKEAPDHDENAWDDEDYRGRHDSYYGDHRGMA